MTTPKYRTDAKACSCPGYWYRRTCNHYRAYGEAMALVVEQDKANAAFSSQGAPIASWEPTESGRSAHYHRRGPLLKMWAPGLCRVSLGSDVRSFL